MVSGGGWGGEGIIHAASVCRVNSPREERGTS